MSRKTITQKISRAKSLERKKELLDMIEETEEKE